MGDDRTWELSRFALYLCGSLLEGGKVLRVGDISCVDAAHSSRPNDLAIDFAGTEMRGEMRFS